MRFYCAEVDAHDSLHPRIHGDYAMRFPAVQAKISALHPVGTAIQWTLTLAITNSCRGRDSCCRSHDTAGLENAVLIMQRAQRVLNSSEKWNCVD